MHTVETKQITPEKLQKIIIRTKLGCQKPRLDQKDTKKPSHETNNPLTFNIRNAEFVHANNSPNRTLYGILATKIRIITLSPLFRLKICDYISFSKNMTKANIKFTNNIFNFLPKIP